jgi:hypothetical protein
MIGSSVDVVLLDFALGFPAVSGKNVRNPEHAFNQTAPLRVAAEYFLLEQVEVESKPRLRVIGSCPARVYKTPI